MRDDFPKLVVSRPSATEIRQFIKSVQATYHPSRQSPKPELYACFRLLSRNLSDIDEAYDIEMCALESLGAELHLERPATMSHTRRKDDNLFKIDPLVSLQDSIISCMKIAYDSFIAGNGEVSR